MKEETKKPRMAVSPEDLEELLKAVEDEFLSAKEAQKKSVENEPVLAQSILQLLVKKINEKVAKTERSLIEKVPTSNESPAISLVIAALKKKDYLLDVSGDKSYTQFIISW
jgi:hypothetical protein